MKYSLGSVGRAITVVLPEGMSSVSAKTSLLVAFLKTEPKLSFHGQILQTHISYLLMSGKISLLK